LFDRAKPTVGCSGHGRRRRRRRRRRRMRKRKRRYMNSIAEYQGNATDEIGVIWVKPVLVPLR